MQHDTFLALEGINARLLGLDQKLDRVLAALVTVTNLENLNMAKIDDLEAEVAHVSSVEDSAKALIEGIAQQLTDLQSSDPRIQAAIDTLRAKSDALAAAVSANTPAAPTPPTP